MPDDNDRKQSEEDQRGNHVAKCVWTWLRKRKAFRYVPWVLDPSSDRYDPLKAAQQNAQDELLLELETVMVAASKAYQ